MQGRRLAIAVAAVVVIAAGVAVLAPGPRDVDVPAHLRGAVADARASLLDHIDLIEPGSPLVLTDLRCRVDGGVLVTFTNRWLWVVERHYYVQSDGPPSGPGSFGGGVLNPTPDPDVERWIAEADGADCAIQR